MEDGSTQSGEDCRPTAAHRSTSCESLISAYCASPAFYARFCVSIIISTLYIYSSISREVLSLKGQKVSINAQFTRFKNSSFRMVTMLKHKVKLKENSDGGAVITRNS